MQAQIQGQGQSQGQKQAQQNWAISMTRMELSTEADVAQVVNNLLRQEASINLFVGDGIVDPATQNTADIAGENQFEDNADYYSQEEDLRGYKTESDGPGWTQIPDDRNANFKTIEEEFNELTFQFEKLGIQSQYHNAAKLLLLELNDNGLLLDRESTIKRVTDQTGFKAEEISGLVDTMKQRINPPGLFAESVRESLQIQVDRLPQSIHREMAVRTMKNDELYNLFISGDILGLANRFKQSQQNTTINDYLLAINKLKIFPREMSSSQSEQTISKNFDPDFKVVVDRDGIKVQAITSNTDSVISQLKAMIHPDSHYSKMMYRLKNSSRKDESEFYKTILGQYQSIKEKVEMLELSKERKIKAVESIVREQIEYINDPAAEPKPLLLKDLAEKVGMSVNTLSNVFRNKNIEVDNSVFPISNLYSLGIRTSSGVRINQNDLKTRIEEVIKRESIDQNALSDQDIARELKAQGIGVSDDTVKRVREANDIQGMEERASIYQNRQVDFGMSV